MSIAVPAPQRWDEGSRHEPDAASPLFSKEVFTELVRMKVQAETCLTQEPSSDPLEIYPKESNQWY